MKQRILVLANDQSLRASLARWLMAAGYGVELAESCKRAREILSHKTIALAILAPGRLGAAELAREIAGQVDRRILITEQGEPVTLPVQADACLVKPLSELETVARVKATLQPDTNELGAARVLRFGRYTLDAGGRSCLDEKGKEVPLTRAEFSLLLALARQPGRVLSRDELHRAMAGRGTEPDDRSVDVLISRLRRKIEADPKAPRIIVTMLGVGYKLIAKPTAAVPTLAETALPTPVFRSELSASANHGLPLKIGRASGYAVAMPNTKGPLAATPDKPSIAVLAFSNMSGDPTQEYFSDGISEDIIADLSKLSELHVIARNSSFAYKGNAIDVKRVARELGVRYMLEGSVRKAGNRVRVTSQLIDGVSGAHIWAERFDRELTDIFAVQDELTQKIISALKVELMPGKKDRLARKGTVTTEAYNLFLRGREHAWLVTRSGNIEARNLLVAAVAIQPDFAAALAFIAFTHVNDYINGWAEDPERSLPASLEIAERAIEIDDEESQAHFAAAIARLFLRDHDRALAEAQRCVALAPNFAEGHLAIAHILFYSDNASAAINMIDAYMRLDPLYKEFALYFLAEARLALGQFDEAIAALKQRLERNPNSETSYALLAACYGHLGKVAEARSAWAEVMRIAPDFSIERRRRILPFKSPEAFEHRIEGMRKAGLQRVPVMMVHSPNV
jgi:TolB-like protein/DNA-binding response OmpR family regulator